MSRKGVRWVFNWAEWQPTENELARAVACVQPEEKSRIGRFVFRKDARASLVGRLLMRRFVHECTGAPYQKMSLVRNDLGKPTVKDLPVSFNASHQGAYTVLAGEPGNLDIGVDVMNVNYTGKSLSEFFRLMRRNFADHEWEEIDEGATEKERAATFYRHWALKESYVKALGVGITIDLGDICFRTKSGLRVGEVVRDTTLFVGGKRQYWTFEESMLDEKHCASVALKEAAEGRVFEKVDPGELLKCDPICAEDPGFCRAYFEKDESPW